MKPCTYVVTKASNDGTFQVGDRIEQLHNGNTWIQNRNIIVEAEESIEGSYGMKSVPEDEYNQSLQEEVLNNYCKDYSYRSQEHIELFIRITEKLLDNHEAYNSMLKLSASDRVSYLAAEAFSITEAMMGQIYDLTKQ